MKLLPAVNDLDESDRICSELFDQITDEKNKLLLDDRNKQETKEAVNRIMNLNRSEQFIDDVTKLVACSMNLGFDFNNLLE